MNKTEILLNANILEVRGRIIMAIKRTGTPSERYKEMFIVQGHKSREKGSLLKSSIRQINLIFFNLPPNDFLKRLKLLHSITESGYSCFNTYNTYLTQTLKIQPTDGDMSCYYNNEGKLDGLRAVYVCDTLSAGLKSFEKPTDMIPSQFKSKPKEYPATLFSGII